MRPPRYRRRVSATRTDLSDLMYVTMSVIPGQEALNLRTILAVVLGFVILTLAIYVSNQAPALSVTSSATTTPLHNDTAPKGLDPPPATRHPSSDTPLPPDVASWTNDRWTAYVVARLTTEPDNDLVQSILVFLAPPNSIASHELTRSSAALATTPHLNIDQFETLEHQLTEQVIVTDDLQKRAHLISLVRDMRRLRALYAPTAPSRQEMPTEASAVNPQSLARAGFPAVTTSLPATPSDQTLKHRYVETRNRFYDDLFSNPDKLLLPLILGMLYFSIIVAGILTGSLYEALGKMEANRKITFRHVFRKVGTPTTWQGILASPIVFAVIIVLVPKDNFSFPMAFLAYQNGFFWRATLQKVADVRESRLEAKAVTA